MQKDHTGKMTGRTRLEARLKARRIWREGKVGRDERLASEANPEARWSLRRSPR